MRPPLQPPLCPPAAASAGTTRTDVRPKGILSSLLLAALTCCTAAPSLPLQPPQPALGHASVIQQAEADGDTGWWPQVLFDARGQAHIAFCDAHNGDVRYGRETEGAWHSDAVVTRGAVGKYLSLDVTRAGQPGIAYYDQDKMYVRYASPDPAGTWSSEAVAWGREAGMGLTLRFDANDRPHLFYYLASGKFVHAHRTEGGWEKAVLSPATGMYSARTSAVLRPDGLWVSYVDWQTRNAALYLAHIDASGRTSNQLVTQEGSPGWHSQVLFDDQAPVLLHAHKLTRKTALTRKTPEGWQTTELLPNGGIFAAQRWNDSWVVAFQDTGDRNHGSTVRYTRSGPGPWPVYTVDTDGPVGGQMSMAISPSGRMLLLYYADKLRSLKLYEEQLSSDATPTAAVGDAHGGGTPK